MKIKHLFFSAMLSMLIFSGCKKEGPAGQDGFNSLIRTSVEPAGDNCTQGGLKVETGLDLNRNSILDNSEVLSVDYVCSNGTLPTTYACRLSQSGTTAPTDTVINNDLGISITWARVAQGKYEGTINTGLDLNRTVLLSNSNFVQCFFVSPTKIALQNTCGVNAWCDDFENFTLEIKVY